MEEKKPTEEEHSLNRFLGIAVLVILCMLSSLIGTWLSNLFTLTDSVTLAISRSTEYAWSIRISCLIVAMYLISCKNKKQ